MTDPMQRLERILINLKNAIEYDVFKRQHGTTGRSDKSAYDEAKAALLVWHKETARAEMLELIDSKVTLPVSPLWDAEDARAFVKSYRAELRQQITKRYGG